jgi:DNA-binding NtrC family response regulator
VTWETALREKTFREDLFYRLNVAVVSLPPLRQRPEDIPDLVNYFLSRYGAELGVESLSIQLEAIQFLQTHPWPGNVRELENVLRQAMLLARKFTITLEHVRLILSRNTPLEANLGSRLHLWIGEFINKAKSGRMDSVYARVIKAIEREQFSQAIDQAQGNQSMAARWLGISRLTMREKLQHFAIRRRLARAKNLPDPFCPPNRISDLFGPHSRIELPRFET